MVRRAGRWIVGSVALLIGVSFFAVLGLRFVDPPLTPLMVLRLVQGATEGRWVGVAHTSVAVDDVSPALMRAVIAAEDQRFFTHTGIDWAAVERARAWNARHPDRRPRGASTITMQCARSTFLWPGGSWLRKGVEVWLAMLMELTSPKRRILETYLNVVEWGDGVYGVEAAAQHWFHVPASRLDAHQAALLAAVLPAPTRWSPARPSRGVAVRASIIQRRAASVRLPPLTAHSVPRKPARRAQSRTTGPATPQAQAASSRAAMPVA